MHVLLPGIPGTCTVGRRITIMLLVLHLVDGRPCIVDSICHSHFIRVEFLNHHCYDISYSEYDYVSIQKKNSAKHFSGINCM